MLHSALITFGNAIRMFLLSNRRQIPPLATTGGPGYNESTQAWKIRMQSKLVEQERAKRDRAQDSRDRAEEYTRFEVDVLFLS